MSVEAFASDVETRGAKVALYRDYVEGDHRNFLTSRMRKQLNLPPTPRSSRDPARQVSSVHDFNANYCGKVVSTKASRLDVDAILMAGANETDTDTLNKWGADLRQKNRFDELQIQEHDSAIGDGECYMLAEWDDDNDTVRWSVEPAYNGIDGTIVKFAADNQTVLFAIKIWLLSDTNGAIKFTRVNVYYPDRIERYIAALGGGLMPFSADDNDPVIEWPLDRVPVVPWINRRVAYTAQGKSEIEEIIGLQDALNYAVYSMTASSTINGFGLYRSVGYAIPETIQAGYVMSVEASTTNASSTGESVSTLPIKSDGDKTFFDPVFERIAGEPPTAYVQQSDWLIMQIAVITDTPLPSLMGGNTQSGEALKQRESGLLAKVKRAQTSFGNSWENLMRLSWEINNEFGSDTLPDIESITTRWKSPEVRADAEIIANTAALVKEGLIDRRTALEAAAPVFDWSEADIDRIIDRLDEQQAAQNDALFRLPFNPLTAA
jgi:hypothetical protein